jgi:hypothetical protein
MESRPSQEREATKDLRTVPAIEQESISGIAHVDFDLSRPHERREWRVGSGLHPQPALIPGVGVWRLNDNLVPWKMTLWWSFPWAVLFGSGCATLEAARRGAEISKRKQALEALRAKARRESRGK